MPVQKKSIIVLLPLLVLLTSAYIVVTAAESSTGDSDLDAVPDTLDIDDDNDSIPDIEELTALGVDRDTDADGMPDRLDLDSDNDGILDVEESGLFRRPEAVHIRLQGGRLRTPVGNNGFADILETVPDSGVLKYAVLNTDADTGDVLPDYLDLDSDNDGLLDLGEAGVPAALDGNRDGRIDSRTGEVGADGILDRLQLQNDANCCDYDGDGSDDVTPRNTDGADFPDFQDLDSDNDGVFDLLEAGGTDLDQDGRVDGFVDNPSNPDGVDDAFLLVPLKPTDANEDGLSDHLDPQTQNNASAAAQPEPQPDTGTTEPAPTTSPADAQQNETPDGPDTTAEPTVTGPNVDPLDGPVDVPVDGPLNDPAAALDDGGFSAINTGLSGNGGCSVGTDHRDPLLPLTALGAFFVLYWQRQLRINAAARLARISASSTNL